jgi:hypothetical protein
VLPGDGGGPVGVEVRDGDHAHVGEGVEVAEVLAADDSGADDGDADRAVAQELSKEVR